MAWRRQPTEKLDSLASLGFGDEPVDQQYDALAESGPVYGMGQQTASSEKVYLGEDVIRTEQGKSFYVHRYSDGSYEPLTPAEVNKRLEVVGGLMPLEQSQADGSTAERKVPTEVKIETGITFWFNTNGHPEYVPDAQQALTRQIEGLSSLTQRQAAELVQNGSQGQEQWYQDQPPQSASSSGSTFDNSGYSRVPAEELPQNIWAFAQNYTGNSDMAGSDEPEEWQQPEQTPTRAQERPEYADEKFDFRKRLVNGKTFRLGVAALIISTMYNAGTGRLSTDMAKNTVSYASFPWNVAGTTLWAADFLRGVGPK